MNFINSHHDKAVWNANERHFPFQRQLTRIDRCTKIFAWWIFHVYSNHLDRRVKNDKMAIYLLWDGDKGDVWRKKTERTQRIPQDTGQPRHPLSTISIPLWESRASLSPTQFCFKGTELLLALRKIRDSSLCLRKSKEQIGPHFRFKSFGAVLFSVSLGMRIMRKGTSLKSEHIREKD